MIYKLLKRVIGRGSFDKADMCNKLNVYRDCHQLTPEQHAELIALTESEVLRYNATAV